MTTSERRSSPRLNLRIPLRFRPIANTTILQQRAESVNLSQHGVYFTTDFPLKVGTPLELFLKMPKELAGEVSPELRCNARVVRVEPNAFGGNATGVGVHIEGYETATAVERWAS